MLDYPYVKEIVLNDIQKLFIDDERFPSVCDGWVIARSSAQAIELCMKNNGLPTYISFDHDLGGDDTSMVFINWAIEKDCDERFFIPKNFRFTVHSQNPIGKTNIEGKLNSYLSFREKTTPGFLGRKYAFNRQT